MSHPVPNLAVSPIFLLGWILLAVWLLSIAEITWRYYRQARITHSEIRDRWTVNRPDPFLLEGEVTRMREAHQEPAPLQLAEPQPSRHSS